MAVTHLRVCAIHAAPRLADCRHCATRSLAVCAALEHDELEALEQVVTPITRAPGQVLFDQGEPMAHVFIVTGGAVKTFKLLADGRRQITGFLQNGDFLGLAGGSAYAFGAEALNQVRLCQIRRRDMDDLLGRMPLLEKRLLSLARDELAVAQEQILLLGRKNARERVASFLAGVAERARRTGRDATTFDLPMTRADIADFLGLTLETVSRTMSGLKRDGIVDFDDARHIHLTRPEALNDIGAGDEDAAR